MVIQNKRTGRIRKRAYLGACVVGTSLKLTYKVIGEFESGILKATSCIVFMLKDRPENFVF